MKKKAFIVVLVLIVLLSLGLFIGYELQRNGVLPYPDAPSSLVTDNSHIALTDYFQKVNQPFTTGFTMENQSRGPVILDGIAPVMLPQGVTVVATSLLIPDENDNIALGVEAGYPPMNGKQPFILHPLHNAVVQPNHSAEAVIALKGPHPGTFTINGFLLTVSINDRTYQRYYNTSVVLCLSVSDSVCTDAYQKVQ